MSTTEGLSLTTTEAKLLIAVIQSHKGPLTPDFESVAAKCGHSSVAVAKASWNRLRRTKLSAEDGVTEKKSPAKKVNGVGEGGSPAKKRKVAKMEKDDVSVKDEEADSDVDADGKNVKDEEI